MTNAAQSVRVDFTKDLASFDFEKRVDPRTSVVQATLVHTVTRKGSYYAFPQGGTDLAEFVTGYGVAVWSEAAHAGNFAALKTKKFLNKFLPGKDDNGIKSIRVVLDALVLSQAHYNIQIEFYDGAVIGSATSIQR